MAKKVIDPVCGMSLRPHRAAATAVHSGFTYYFCSLSCHQTFLVELAEKELERRPFTQPTERGVTLT